MCHVEPSLARKGEFNLAIKNIKDIITVISITSITGLTKKCRGIFQGVLNTPVKLLFLLNAACSLAKTTLKSGRF